MNRVPIGKVVDAIERHRGGHYRVGRCEARLQLRIVRGQRHQCGQVATGGAASDGDERGADMPAVSMTQPGLQSRGA